jgi:hypothetical protein
VKGEFGEGVEESIQCLISGTVLAFAMRDR